ncbi:MAG: anaerobic ribonucleoside-triphosphate reductase [Nitrososphaeraceae archaeon]|nr:anaerobic ribonucleoside-triphosphate reductase [Nitrososphaeraceae archaeon]MDW0204090.1 anaerobic ribonucleoside-triphosphate reductase [Nitrososphaeraceae archaeon]MDW0217305.1 anaerobic ribonucleoside-triphosphate reductase [Nitrososphaeraceae archaeon]MDW0221895.1 anaerobic ribonucleoside-triphosphate reductase [Nitrososphaeraceae archaeon]MDW0223925.1 anaerobic ribonucleoside-triphosphate reductase [Nitrososphaeraceae archaeon]
MEIEASHDLITQTETKPSGILQAAKRVRMIFSVMASPNRIDILRILNSKGPLTYSELKSLAGFKSKKESGKFAYHLRKLLRQSLVALNKAERRYTITNLGKLVLSLARQIEERSIIESGKMYVRTSRHSIEEFNSNRITQSLVREANMPLEQAHKITEEVENKVYKFQTVYLTSSLIRETVNSILIEHGYEEFRSKLARLGLPGSDISEMFNNPLYSKNGVEGILSETSLAVFSENLLFNMLPKDITDMHLAGELNISNTGLWNLVPDTVFIDTRNFVENGLDFKGKYLNVSRLKPIRTLDDITEVLPVLISVLSRETSREIILDNFVSSISKRFQESSESIEAAFSRAFISSSISRSFSSSGYPVVTFPIYLDESSITRSILAAYMKYLDHTPIPTITLSLVGKDHESLATNSDLIASIVKNGGILSASKNFRSHMGIVKNAADEKASSIVSLQSLAINLPRLAYQSNKDETYFRARLALMIKPAISALLARKNSILEMIRREMLPVMANITQMMQLSRMNLVINLTGVRESVYNILGHEFDGEEIIQKVLHTAVQVASDQGKQVGDDSIRIAMITDDSSTRLASLDSEKYGNMYRQAGDKMMIKSYSQGLLVNGRDLLSNSGPIIESTNSIDELLNGGVSINVDTSDLEDNELIESINKSYGFNFFRPIYRNKICSSCGTKISMSSGVCKSCGSTNFSNIIIPNQ